MSAKPYRSVKYNKPYEMRHQEKPYVSSSLARESYGSSKHSLSIKTSDEAHYSPEFNKENSHSNYYPRDKPQNKWQHPASARNYNTYSQKFDSYNKAPAT